MMAVMPSDREDEEEEEEEEEERVDVVRFAVVLPPLPLLLLLLLLSWVVIHHTPFVSLLSRAYARASDPAAAARAMEQIATAQSTIEGGTS